METYNFYKIEEIRLAKKEKRQPFPVFGITSDPGSIRFFIKRLELVDGFVWMDASNQPQIRDAVASW